MNGVKMNNENLNKNIKILNRINEFADEIEQNQIQLMRSIRDEIDDVSNSKVELEELLQDVQNEFICQQNLLKNNVFHIMLHNINKWW